MNGQVFNTDQMNTALRALEDVMERMPIHYLLLDETARLIHDERELKGSEITIGIYKLDVTDGIKTAFEQYAKAKIGENEFTCAIEGVPVKVKLINKDKEYFEFPDSKVYNGGFYKIPNQFERYWSER